MTGRDVHHDRRRAGRGQRRRDGVAVGVGVVLRRGRLIGADGKGILPGKYRVEIIMAPVGSPDVLKGKYSRQDSKIEVEVKEGEDLIIDLAKFK